MLILLVTLGGWVYLANIEHRAELEAEGTSPTVVEADECQGATPEVQNAIYAAKLKNARARNLGVEWEDNAKLIEAAEKAAADCENVRAKILANKAEDQADDSIAQINAK